MTAQIHDNFIFKGEEYDLIGLKGGDLFSPEKFGMYPVMMDTSCYRGFYATYEISGGSLFLRDLTLSERDGNYLPIDSVIPDKEDYQASYHNLSLRVPFSGELRLAKGFIEKLYIHMGYQNATSFKTVLDLTLDNGKVISVKNRSREMKQKRKAFKKHFESENTIQTIEDSFSLNMDFE